MQEKIVKRYPSPWSNYRDAMQFLQDLNNILHITSGRWMWFDSDHSSLKTVKFFKDYDDPIL